MSYLFEETVEIHVDSITRRAIEQNVLAVSISQAVCSSRSQYLRIRIDFPVSLTLRRIQQ